MTPASSLLNCRSYRAGALIAFCICFLAGIDARATAPSIGITNFNSLTGGALLGSTPSPGTAPNVGSLGWDFTITTPGSNVSMSIQAAGANPGGASDFSIRMNSLTAGVSVQTIGVKSNDASFFSLKYVYLKLNLTAGAPANVVITGYRSGVAMTGATKTVNGIATNPVWTQFDVSAIAAFGNIDEFRFTQAGTSTATISFEVVDEINIAAAIPLPLILTDFRGRLTGNSVQLNWITASEENTSYFEVQRATDGTGYTPAGKVPAAGNSEGTLHYYFTDLLPSGTASVYFYRLKMADIDGNFSYSTIVKVGEPAGRLSLNVYPNPFRQFPNIVVSIPRSDNAVITVSDMRGRTLLKQSLSLQKGSNSLSLPALSKLGKGAYLFSISSSLLQEKLGLLKIE